MVKITIMSLLVQLNEGFFLLFALSIIGIISVFIKKEKPLLRRIIRNLVFLTPLLLEILSYFSIYFFIELDSEYAISQNYSELNLSLVNFYMGIMVLVNYYVFTLTSMAILEEMNKIYIEKNNEKIKTKQSEEKIGKKSWNPLGEKRLSFADSMERFMKFYSSFMNLSKINVMREFEPELNNLQEEMRLFHKKIDDLFFKVPQEFREGT